MGKLNINFCGVWCNGWAYPKFCRRWRQNFPTGKERRRSDESGYVKLYDVAF